jgi:leucyl-tRNA synthetase
MAYKLSHGDESVKTNLLNSGVPEEDIANFHDPQHWIEHFPAKAFELLKSMNMKVDLSRSFITTDRNPYYDSFVRWQFNKLKSLGFVFKGKRYSIYSQYMKLICGDHERSVGEGVGYEEYELIHEGKRIIAAGYEHFDDDEDNDVHKDGFIVNNILLDNIVHQDLELATAKHVKLPTEPVVSRAGDTCIVALTDQWYINYADEEWKSQVRSFIEDELETYNPSVKTDLLTSLDWIREWGFSREVGLGTKIPWDPKYVIDSLSDSTIYMAYYTVAHLLHKDIYGDEPNLVTPDELSDEFWDSVFSSDVAITYRSGVIGQLQREFRKWYPVDLRVSGKDLIPNHLLMCMYNHIAIFGKHMAPRSYMCNGFITIDKEKMSKSTGNFITVEKAIADHGEDAVRLTLASAGDSTEDANFDARTLASMKSKLAKFTLPTTMDVISKRDEINFKLTVTKLKDAYEHGRFQDVIKYAFHAKNPGADAGFYRIFLHPIIPSTIDPPTEDDILIYSMMEPPSADELEYLEDLNYINEFVKKVNKCLAKSRKKKITITKISSTVYPNHEKTAGEEFLKYVRDKTKFAEIYLEVSEKPHFKLNIE